MTRIALAIVVGCAAIAIALYLGLRAQAPRPAPPPPAAPDRDTLRALALQAAGQLEATRAQLDAACWPATGAGTAARYDVQLAIDPAGREIGRSVLERRDVPSSPAVAACVRRQAAPPITVAAPGAPVTLTIPLVLP